MQRVYVFELVNIQLKDIDMSLPGVKVLGKGNKERFVPFGEFCRQSIEQYLREFKPIQHTKHSFLLVNMNGAPITESVRYVLNDVVKRQQGLRKFTPQTKTYVCNTFTQSRCGFKNGTIFVRTC